MIQTLTVSLRPSRVLSLSLTAAAGAAAGCAWISLPLLAFAPVAAGIALAWAWHIARILQRRPGSVHALELAAQGNARWQDGSGQWHEAEILPSSYVSGWLVVMNLSGGGGRRRSVVLLPDSVVAEEMRRLRVWLRWRLGGP